ncbi:MAG: hypothetical protein KGN02_00890 [bacterium]|nr:hypothetical protein [bacterium]
MLTKLARLGMGLAAIVLAGTTVALAETSATPAHTTVAQASAQAKATPNPFSYKGYVRAYDFTRQNASGNTPGVNQQSFNAALNLHGEYKFTNSGFSVGATYLYANPLNNCTTAQSHFTPPCGNNKAPGINPDDTLPGYELNTLYEAYLGFNDKTTHGKLGYQVFNSPWANASDSRLKPVAFLGGDLGFKFNSNWNGEIGYFDGFEDRASSQFFRSTLLTYSPVDAPGYTSLASSTTTNKYVGLDNSGFFYGRVGYTGPKSSPLAANLYYYGVSDIANILWLDAKYPFAGKLHPFVAGQFGTEKSTGAAQVGLIDSQVFGLQGGFNPMQNVTVTLGYNHIPSKTANVTLPAGVICSASHTLPNGKGIPYFIPAGGTPSCVAGATPGTATIYYGGWASPYTDSYATDPLFTTAISQGMADRRAFGDGAKLAVTFTSNDKRFVATVARALYAYGNSAVGVSPTQETNFDTMYYFNKMPKSGGYKGFMVRYRYAERTQTFTYAGGLPLFKYNRFQAEYDF